MGIIVSLKTLWMKLLANIQAVHGKKNNMKHQKKLPYVHFLQYSTTNVSDTWIFVPVCFLNRLLKCCHSKSVNLLHHNHEW